MQALFSHYRVGRFSQVFFASCLEALHIVYDAAHPYAALTWRVLSSPEALALYRFLWRSLLALLALIALVAFTAGSRFREWCDRFVDDRLAVGATPEQPDPLDQPPVKTATVAEMEPWDAPLEPSSVPLPPAPCLLPSAFVPALPPAQAAPVVTVEAKQPKKRGRPKGSKNKALAAV